MRREVQTRENVTDGLDVADTLATLTVDEAAVLLRVSRRQVYYLLNQGGFPATRVGHRIRIPVRDLRRYLEANRIS
jgi:excisionase family DNA binding protein